LSRANTRYDAISGMNSDDSQFNEEDPIRSIQEFKENTKPLLM
jgi:hypothetical protein